MLFVPDIILVTKTVTVCVSWRLFLAALMPQMNLLASTYVKTYMRLSQLN